jgi:hypothetical protein
MGEASGMASGHGAHDDHGHDDHGHAPESSMFVVPPMIVGIILALVIIIALGTQSTAIPWHSPF